MTATFFFACSEINIFLDRSECSVKHSRLTCGAVSSSPPTEVDDYSVIKLPTIGRDLEPLEEGFATMSLRDESVEAAIKGFEFRCVTEGRAEDHRVSRDVISACVTTAQQTSNGDTLFPYSFALSSNSVYM